MTKTLVDVDDRLLADAQRVLGTQTKKSTMNEALREVVRRAAAVDLVVMARDGLFGPDEERL
jgi:Arc/MetJ family transcription regulator